MLCWLSTSTLSTPSSVWSPSSRTYCTRNGWFADLLAAIFCADKEIASSGRAAHYYPPMLFICSLAGISIITSSTIYYFDIRPPSERNLLNRSNKSLFFPSSSPPSFPRRPNQALFSQSGPPELVALCVGTKRTHLLKYWNSRNRASHGLDFWSHLVRFLFHSFTLVHVYVWLPFVAFLSHKRNFINHF